MRLQHVEAKKIINFSSHRLSSSWANNQILGKLKVVRVQDDVKPTDALGGAER